MKSKIKKITVLGQDYLVKTNSSSNMNKIVDYVNEKMSEATSSGMDINSQQLKIVVFACLEIAGELFEYKKSKLKTLNKLESHTQLIIEEIDKKLNKND